MISTIIGILVGSFITWLITHLYYKKSSTVAPDWAKPLIERLPEKQPSEQELIDIFQDFVEEGKIQPDELTGYLKCPKCNRPSTEFTHETHENTFGDDN